MTWAVVSVCESNSVDLPPEVTARAAEVLIELGWTPPPEVH